VNPSFKEYETLKTLYAGASVSFFDSKLGPPSIVSPARPEMGVTERLYVEKDYVVETLATADGQTTLFSVLSCNPSFKPTFSSGGGPITLQNEPLAALMPERNPHVFYRVPGTAGGPEFFFEMIDDVAGYTNYRGSGYGVNSRCGPLPSQDVQDFEGGANGAPQGIAEYRATTPANFYVETYGRSLLGINGEAERYYLVTPNPVSLPPGWGQPRNARNVNENANSSPR